MPTTPTTPGTHTSGKTQADSNMLPMQECINACWDCHQICLRTALTHCLKAGGDHVGENHFRLMMNCAEVCQTSANLQLSNSTFSKQQCTLCAAVCEACCHSCEGMDGMEEVMQACKLCAKSCNNMSGSKH